MGNAPPAPSYAEVAPSAKHRSVEERQRKRMELNQKRSGAHTSTKKRDAVIVSAGRVEDKKDLEKKEVVKDPDPDAKAAHTSKSTKKNEKDIFVCNWLDRMEAQKPFDPQELAVDGID